MTNRKLLIFAAALVIGGPALVFIVYEWNDDTPVQADVSAAPLGTDNDGAQTQDAGEKEVGARSAAARLSAIETDARDPQADPRLRPLVTAFEQATQQAKTRQTNSGQTSGEPQAKPAADDAKGGKDEDKVWDTDREGIQGAIQASMPQIKECYDPWLKLNPDLGGRITAAFVIGTGEGNAARAAIADVTVKEGGLGNQFLEGCLLSVLSALAFKLPEGGGRLTVHYPFVFSAKDVPEEK